jgi:uncharacterized membrane protein
MVFAVVLAVVGIVLIVAGIVLYANGVGVNPDGRTEGERVRQGFSRVPYREMFGTMPRSVKVLTDSDAAHDDRVRGAGSFTTLVGIVLVGLAIVAAIAASL